MSCRVLFPGFHRHAHGSAKCSCHFCRKWCIIRHWIDQKAATFHLPQLPHGICGQLTDCCCNETSTLGPLGGSGAFSTGGLGLSNTLPLNPPSGPADEPRDVRVNHTLSGQAEFWQTGSFITISWLPPLVRASAVDHYIVLLRMVGGNANDTTIPMDVRFNVPKGTSATSPNQRIQLIHPKSLPHNDFFSPYYFEVRVNAAYDAAGTSVSSPSSSQEWDPFSVPLGVIPNFRLDTTVPLTFEIVSDGDADIIVWYMSLVCDTVMSVTPEWHADNPDYNTDVIYKILEPNQSTIYATTQTADNVTFSRVRIPPSRTSKLTVLVETNKQAFPLAFAQSKLSITPEYTWSDSAQLNASPHSSDPTILRLTWARGDGPFLHFELVYSEDGTTEQYLGIVKPNTANQNTFEYEWENYAMRFGSPTVTITVYAYSFYGDQNPRVDSLTTEVPYPTIPAV